jgi:DNA repair exonuclease SbcCD ATPase subunit
MKIRAIEVTNLRRFGGSRARIDGIGDGVTVLSEPNEFGKSTLFDALHALFFERHRSTKAPVKSLQPHSGGAPEAAVELELPTGRFRVEKRWLSRPTARVLDAGGRLIAQDDEAEAWIDRLTGQGLAGPSGLLWVRQGLLGLEPEGATAADKHERERGLSARRDLLSSVAGEIELMTGGRRMDLVLARVTEALSRLATATLRPKAGGDWARAVDEAAELASRRTELETKAQRLTEELRGRARLQREIATLSDPEARTKTDLAVVEAKRAFDAAEAHSRQITQAESTLRLAQLTAAQGRSAITRLEDLATRALQAEQAQQQAQAGLLQMEADLSTAREAESKAAERHEAATAGTRGLTVRIDSARRAQLALAARDKVKALAARLTRAEDLRREIEAFTADRAGFRVTPKLMEAAETAKSARDRLLAQLEAQLVTVSFAYTGQARAVLAGQEVSAAPIHLRALAQFDLPGLGRLTVDPGAATAGDTEAALVGAEAGLTAALTACGAPDMAAARQALVEVQRLDTALSNARSLLKEVAPEGIDALNLALSRARGEALGEADAPVEDLPALDAALGPAREAELAAQAEQQVAHARTAALAERRAAGQATAEAAARALQSLRQEAGDPLDLAARLLHLRAAQTALASAEQAAEAELAQVQLAAPDLATTAAALKRMLSIQTQRQSDLERLTRDLAGINGSIGALADEGIEELLDEVRGREATLLARAARYGGEVQALARLRAALEAARRAARETYFGPVLRELAPLIAILHPGASLQIDDESLLPTALTREGQSEGLDILSGGTREQIAILTRLAFARLFAKGGQAVPVILDDALVHSDDDRIEAMFTALHRVAQDQQIIVLTCRQRAFASLGGDRIHATIEPV